MVTGVQPALTLMFWWHSKGSTFFFLCHWMKVSTPKGQTDRAVSACIPKHGGSVCNVKKVTFYSCSARTGIWNQLTKTAVVNQSGQGVGGWGRTEGVREKRYIEMRMRVRLVRRWGWLMGVVHREDHTLLFSPPVFLVLDLPAFL